MSFKFMVMMGEIQEFLDLPFCKVCQSRACKRPGNCDKFHRLDKAIQTSSRAAHHFDNLEELDAHGFADLKDLSKEQVFLVYKAGEILANNRKQ